MKLDVFDLNNNKVKEIDVKDSIFNAKVKEHLLHEVVKAQLYFRRAGTAKTKERSEVSGTTKKMYKQKGTGNARHGSRKSPLFPKGGTVFGPKGELGKYKVNKKVMKGGLLSALSLAVKNDKLRIVNGFELETHKTREFKSVLDKFSLKKVLIISDYDPKEDKLYLASRNIRDTKLLKLEGINVFDMLKYQNILIDEKSLKKLEDRLS